MTLVPRKLLVAAVATLAVGACTPTSRGPAVRSVAMPTPVTQAVSNEAPPPAATPAPAPTPVLAVEATPEPAAATPRTDENGRPLCGNVRSKRSSTDCDR